MDIQFIPEAVNDYKSLDGSVKLLINEKIDKLKENPYVRPLVQNKYLSTKGIRFIKVKKYMLIYKINEKNKTVFLYRFIYSRRDWINILTTELKNS